MSPLIRSLRASQKIRRKRSLSKKRIRVRLRSGDGQDERRSFVAHVTRQVFQKESTVATEFNMPSLSKSHVLRCEGENGQSAIVIPTGGEYFYVGVVDGDGEVTDIPRG